MQGRPRLFPRGSGKQLNVEISLDDHRALSEVKRARPGYNFGDLVRGYIRRGLARDLGRHPHQLSADPKQTPARQLFAIARRARRLAQELERSQ